MTGAPFGAFGKIPSVGDFFRIDAPSGFVRVWDDWLQRCLVSGAHTFGSRWDDLYMSVPIWRFCLSAGLAGPAKILGVLMPSVDRVGRRFPLTLMAQLPDDVEVFATHFAARDLFEALEDLALAALDETGSREELADGLSQMTVPPSLGEAQFLRASSTILIRGVPAQSLSAIAAAGLLRDAFEAASIWSADLKGDARLMVCDGLPEGANMQALFDLDADIWAERMAE